MLVPCFGREVKPYRLLLPALARRVNAGVRLPRDPRASVRESLRTEAAAADNPASPEYPRLSGSLRPILPLRFAQASAGDFPLRVPFGEWPLELADAPSQDGFLNSAVAYGHWSAAAKACGSRACCGGRLKRVRAGVGFAVRQGPCGRSNCHFLRAELARTDAFGGSERGRRPRREPRAQGMAPVGNTHPRDR